MMIDATVAPKVGFISPFGTTVCNVNHINAGHQARRTAGARHERTLFAVAWMPWLGAVVIVTPGLPTTASGALTRLLCLHALHHPQHLGRRVPRLPVRPP